MVLADFISLVRRRPALKGSSEQVATDYINRALLAISSYAPLKVTMLRIPARRTDGVYEVPEEAREVTEVYVSGTNVPITFEVKEKEDGTRELWLYAVRLPSSISLVDSPDYNAYSTNLGNITGSFRPTFGGSTSGYDFYDLEYSANHTFERLLNKHHLALEIYVDYLGYEARAVKEASLVDITDRDPSGASTTLRRSQASGTFSKLMDMRMAEFKREMTRPYWTRSSFGLIERLWIDRSNRGDAIYLD